MIKGGDYSFCHWDKYTNESDNGHTSGLKKKYAIREFEGKHLIYIEYEWPCRTSRLPNIVEYMRVLCT